MKTTKKILVCMLAVVILVTAFALSASAAGESGYTYDNMADVLEYYTEDGMFFCDFEDAEVGDYTGSDVYNGKSSQTVKVEADADGNKYLVLTGGTRSSGTMVYYWNSDNGLVDDFVLEFTVSAKDTATTNKQNIFYVYIDSESIAPTSSLVKNESGETPITIVALNYNTGCVEYTYFDDSASINSAVTKSLVKANGDVFAISEEQFYNVHIVYMSDGTYSLRVEQASDPSVYAEVSGVKVPDPQLNGVKGIALGTTETYMSYTTVYLDNIGACSGTFVKDFNDTAAESEKALLAIYDLCENSTSLTIDQKLELVTVGQQIVAYGFTTENADVQKVIDALPSYGVTLYSSQVVACVERAAQLTTYSSRVANVEKYQPYYDSLVELDLTPFEESVKKETAEIIAAFDAEVALLEANEENSLEYIKLLSEVDLAGITDGVENYDNYDYLISYVNAAKQIEYYAGYDLIDEESGLTVADMMAVQSRLETLSDGIKEKGDAFIEQLEAALGDQSFASKYENYKLAVACFYDNETYPGITEAIDQYLALVEEMSVKIALCDGFIHDVCSADYSQYITAKEQSLALAGAVVDEILAKYSDYPGFAVEDGAETYFEMYDRLCKEVTTDRNNANAYIAAVNGLMAKIDNGELAGDGLWDAILEVEELQEAGNVTGVDGIAAANIYLNNVKSLFELSAGYAEQFANLVAKLDNETDAATRYSVILAALASAESAEKYDGVSAADEAKLDTAIENYNATVQAINSVFTSINETACNVVSATAGAQSASTGRVIALIKKFYE